MLSLDSNYASDISDDASATGSIENPMYKCKYCPRKFDKTQALGGHQNAHRREREVKKQHEAFLVHLNQPEPDLYLYSYLHPHSFPNQYALPPGFEQRRYKVDKIDNMSMVYNQYMGSSSSGFLGLRSDPSQGMDRGWTFNGIPSQTQPQPLSSTSSPVCLDLCLGVGCSQTQPQPEEPNDATEDMDAEKENDCSSLSLSLKL
ncbi:unnamed protein product [Arabidopsis halleri]